MSKYYAEVEEGRIVLDAVKLEEAKDEARRLETVSQLIDVFEVGTDEHVATVEVE